MIDLEKVTNKLKNPWLITVGGGVAIAGLIAMPIVVGAPQAERMPDIVRFIGHFHPVILHLPIGIFALLMFQELVAIFWKSKADKKEVSLFPMFFGAASAIMAVVTGFLLYQGEDYGASAVIERHLFGGLSFAVAAVVTFIVKSWTISNALHPAFFRVMLFGSVGVMGLTSHDGASITHGDDFLTKFAPDPIRKIIGLEPKKVDGTKKLLPDKKEEKKVDEAAKSQLVYADLVAPILERRCVQCHKEGKVKGKLRMDSFEMLAKGGKGGPVFIAGNTAESQMLIRVHLPKDDEEHMPPDGKTPLEEHEIAVISWWIENGADNKKAVNEISASDAVKAAIGKLLPGVKLDGGAHPEASVPHAVSAGPDDKMKALVAGFSKDFPGAVSFESQNSTAMTFTAVSLRSNLDDAGFAKLQAILPQLVSLDLSATKITDQAVAMLAVATNLKQVRLAETAITDGSLGTLAKLSSLESINLYGTKVSDAGIEKLQALPNLKRLYLWQTTVTPEAINALKKKLPSCQVVLGGDV
jgi:uncharacterized membrane protein